MTSPNLEQAQDFTAQTVDNILSRAGTLIHSLDLVKKTGRFLAEDSLTGETASAAFDEHDELKDVDVTLTDPVRFLNFDADGTVTITFGRFTKVLFDGGEVNYQLRPKEQRQAIGYIATAGAVFDDLVEAQL